MAVGQLVGGVGLDAVCKTAAIDVGGDTVEGEVAGVIRHEMQRAVAGEIRQLQVEALNRLLVGQHAELAVLGLPLVEVRRVEGVGDEVVAAAGRARRLARIVRDLVGAGRGAADEDQARGRIDDGGEIDEALALIGVVVDRAAAGRRVLDAEIAAEVAAGDEILRLANGAAVFEARRHGAVAAAIDADAAAVVEGIRLGLDIEHAGGAQAVLRRQRAGEQRHAADDPGVDDLPERADAVREHDAVDAVLQVGVLVADMQRAAGGGILGHAGRLQQHLVERRIGSLRHRLDVLLVELIGARADRRQQLGAGAVEGRPLPADDLGLGGRPADLRCRRADVRAPRPGGTPRRRHAHRRQSVAVGRCGSGCRRRRRAGGGRRCALSWWRRARCG